MASWLRAAEELFEVVDRKVGQAVVRGPSAADDSLGPLQTAASEPGAFNRLSSAVSREKGSVHKLPQSLGPTSFSASKAIPVQLNGKGTDFSHKTVQSHNLLSSPERAEHVSFIAEEKAAVNNGSVDLAPSPGEIASEEVGGPTGCEEGEAQRWQVSLPRKKSAQNVLVPNGDASHKGESSPALPGVDGALLLRSSNLGRTESSGSLDGANATRLDSLETVENNNSWVLEQSGQPSPSLSNEEVEPVQCEFRAENGSVVVELFTARKPHAEEPVALVQAVGNTKVLDDMPAVGNAKLLEQPLPPPPPDEPKSAEMPKVEDQLDEARGLLTVAVSSGPSKEARLARVCAGLSSRLQEYKAENAQLEELLHLEREEKSSFDTRVRHVQQELAAVKAAAAAEETEMLAALASKNAEIEALSSSLDALRRQASMAEGKLAALQANTEAMSKNRDMSETRMIQALREELASAERRVEEERIAHSATRHGAVERETELEQRMAESTSALMRMLRTVDERTQKAADLEHKLSMLEVECATLNQELQEMEARQRRELKRPNEEAAQTAQAWREEAERARQSQREAEGKLSAMEAEMQKLRVELASLKRNADRSSLQAQSELEKRFRELTELLYFKQTQLEAVSSEKAAAVLQLEEAWRLQAKAEAERHRSLRNAAAGDDDELKSFESFGLQQRRLGPSFQTVAKFLDSTVVTAGRFLWRRPLARLIALFYLVFVHFFLMYVLHRLQEQAVILFQKSSGGSEHGGFA